MAALALLGVVAVLEERAAHSDAVRAFAAVTIARHDIPAGAVLAGDDVATAQLPRDSPLLAVAIGPGDAVGRRTANPLAAGEMVTPGRLLDAADAPPGTTVMPVTFSDSDIAAYLTPGTVLDIMWTPEEFSGQAPRVVAQGCVVVESGPPGTQTAHPSWGARPVLLQVRDADTVALAAAMSSGRLSVLLRGP